jgi:hypothetical protein
MEWQKALKIAQDYVSKSDPKRPITSPPEIFENDLLFEFSRDWPVALIDQLALAGVNTRLVVYKETGIAELLFLPSIPESVGGPKSDPRLTGLRPVDIGIA